MPGDLIVAAVVDDTQAVEALEVGLPRAAAKWGSAYEGVADRNIAKTQAQIDKLLEMQAILSKKSTALAAAGATGTAPLAVDAQLAKTEKQLAALGLTSFAVQKTVGQNLDTMATKAMSVGRSMTMYLTAPFALVAVEAAKMAINFQRQMEMIHTQAGANQREVTRQSQALLQYAASGRSPVSPIELSQGLYFSESRGFRGGAATNLTKIASEAAGMGMANMEDVSNALGGAALSYYGKQPTRAEIQATMGVVNATVGAGAMRMQDYANALRTGVAPAAHDVGVTLNELGAALAVMTDRGMPAQMAATRLRMTIAMMEKPTQAATKALGDLGIAPNQLATLMASGPTGFLKAIELLQAGRDRLAQEYGKPGDIRGQGDIIEAFGKGRSSAGIITLVNSLASPISSLQGKLAQIDRQQKNFNQDWIAYTHTAQYQLSSSWHAIQADLINLGGAMAPVLVQIGHGVKDLTAWFTGLPKPVKDAVGVVALLAGALGPILLATGLFIKAGRDIQLIWGTANRILSGSTRDANRALGPERAQAAEQGSSAVKTTSGEESAAQNEVTTSAADANAALGTQRGKDAKAGASDVVAANATVNTAEDATLAKVESVNTAVGIDGLGKDAAEGAAAAVTAEDTIGAAADANVLKVDALKTSLLGIAGTVVTASILLSIIPGTSAGQTALNQIGAGGVGSWPLVGHIAQWDARLLKFIWGRNGQQWSTSGGFQTPAQAKAVENLPGNRFVRLLQAGQGLKGKSQIEAFAQTMAGIFGIDANTFLRQLNDESGFDPTAVSPKGATGVGQFMPGTLKGMLPAGISPGPGALQMFLRNPAVSTYYAAKLMAELQHQYGGNEALALAAYNAGSGRVNQFVAGREQLPAETVAYVKAIMGSQGISMLQAGTNLKVPGAITGANNPESGSLHPSTNADATAAAKKAAAAAKKAGDVAAKAIIDPITQALSSLKTNVSAAFKAKLDPKQIEAALTKEIEYLHGEITQVTSDMDSTKNSTERARLQAELTKLKNDVTLAIAARTAEVQRAAKVIIDNMGAKDATQYTTFSKQFTELSKLAQYTHLIPGVTADYAQQAQDFLGSEAQTLNAELSAMKAKLAGAKGTLRTDVQTKISTLNAELLQVNSDFESTLQNNISNMQAAYQTALQNFDQAFSTLSQDVMQQFNDQTQDYVKNVLAPQFFQGTGQKTPAEQTLEAFQDQQQALQEQRAIIDAQKRYVTDVSQGADIDTIQADADALQAARNAVTLQQLQDAATASRTAADQAYAVAEQQYTDKRQAESLQLSASLKQLGRNIDNGTASLSDINGILQQYGVTLTGVDLATYQTDYVDAQTALTNLTTATGNLESAFDALIKWINAHVGTNFTTTTTGGGGGGAGTTVAYDPKTGVAYTSTPRAIPGHAIALAGGGVVNTPTLAIVGEAGPEAVIPLSRLGGGTGELHIHFEGPIMGSAQDVAKEIGPSILEYVRRYQNNNASAGFV